MKEIASFLFRTQNEILMRHDLNFIWPPTGSINYWQSLSFWKFQNGCNKVVIELRVVQFWSEITLVISNQTQLAAHSSDFKITRMISDQIHSTYTFSLKTDGFHCHAIKS